MLSYLIDLLKLGAGDKIIRAPTTYLSVIFNVSQQTASRIISELAEEGYVYKEVRNGSLWIRLTDKAISEINEYIRYIRDAYEHPGYILLEGYVEKGLGEGAYYMSKRRYQIQFYKILGFYPYPGTLNLRLKDYHYILQNRLLRRLPGYRIQGFKTRERVFGGAKVFKAVVEDKYEAGVVYADRSVYGFDIVEVISPYYLRGVLNLKDGDRVRVKVLLEF